MATSRPLRHTRSDKQMTGFAIMVDETEQRLTGQSKLLTDTTSAFMIKGVQDRSHSLGLRSSLLVRSCVWHHQMPLAFPIDQKVSEWKCRASRERRQRMVQRKSSFRREKFVSRTTVSSICSPLPRPIKQ